MKVSDYIVEFFMSKGITDTFGYPGGMVTHLMDSFDKYKEKISTHITYHEQAAAFAACGYAQISHKLGVAYATSGPGATNLITGIANAYFDSIPCMFITGQVNTYEQKGSLKCRQKGFQETDIVSIVKPITKYAIMIENENNIVYELEKAYWIATEGRKGPVLLDIPMNIQRAEIDLSTQKKFLPEAKEKYKYESIMETISKELEKAKRPVIIAGAGINISNVRSKFRELVSNLKIPVITTMISRDILPENSEYNFGFVGAYGDRASNIIISKSDCILTIGARLGVRQTGNKEYFNKEAIKLRIDIDEGELTNSLDQNEIKLVADLETLLPYLLNIKIKDSKNEWYEECLKIKSKLDKIDETEQTKIIKLISHTIDENTNIVTDVGQNQVWISQAFDVKENQRILYSGGHGAMGYSLPAAIGAYYAEHKNVVSFNGDGGIQMNIQELEFLARENIPIKVIVINNHSLGMIRHFQEMYFNSNYTLTTSSRGYDTPDFCKIAEAYGIDNYCINNLEDINRLGEILKNDRPTLINVNIGDITYTYPKLGMNQPIYNQEPFLDKSLIEELLENK